MFRLCSVCAILSLSAFTLAGCDDSSSSMITDASAVADGSVIQDAGVDGAGGTPMKVSALPFAASNVTPDVLNPGAPGDMIFNGTACGNSTEVEIDTDNGKVRSCNGIVLGTNYRFVKAAQADTSMVAVFITRVFRIDTTLTVKVEGQLPAVIVALDKVEILGSLDAGGNDVKGVAGGFPGRDNSRGMGNGPGAGGAGVVGGGGGASFCGLGGTGFGGGVPGTMYGSPTLLPLIGGSSGGAGGIWGSGAGGGAIQLIAGKTILVTATGKINVGGGGGGQAGCGGGSGGALLIEAPVVTIAGALGANGGGGGAGAGAVRGEEGTASNTAAKGGADNGVESPGGTGSAAAVLNGGNGAANATVPTVGAGGGGGAGRIRINTTSGTATITGIVSPALTSGCASQGNLL